jgi:hypothetical protein
LVGLHHHATIRRNIEQEQKQEQEQKKNPVSHAFKYLNLPETQRQYPKRLKLLFDHVGLTGDSLWKLGSKPFWKRLEKIHSWVQEKIIDFKHFHKQRVQRKELAAGTLTFSYLLNYSAK